MSLAASQDGLPKRATYCPGTRGTALASCALVFAPVAAGANFDTAVVRFSNRTR